MWQHNRPRAVEYPDSGWKRTIRFLKPGVLIGLAALVLAQAGCRRVVPPDQQEPARFVREVEWAGKGVWVKADTHAHTTWSDGSHSVEEVVAKAREFGCDVVAITDHSDRGCKSASPEQLEAIEASRRQHPELIILAGLEWNVPPYGGREHATVLISPDLDELRTLGLFKSRFDDPGRKGNPTPLAAEALRWLEANATAKGVKPVVIYNHPSRKDDNSMENVKDMLEWRKVNDLFVGFEGAPGHQGSKGGIGSYRYKVKTIDRWDPVVAQVGDAWDTLLGQGLDVWGARADSDFHNNSPNGLNDYWPGQFSETWLYAPKRSAGGVLQAFRAGSFFASHGHIARQVELTIEAPGLPRPAGVGEAVALPAGSSFTATLRCVVPALDWQGQPNQVDTIEFICITHDSASVRLAMPLGKDGVAKSDPIAVPPGGVVVRARGRRDMPGGPNLLFYTNPIRIQSGH